MAFLKVAQKMFNKDWGLIRFFQELNLWRQLLLEGENLGLWQVKGQESACFHLEFIVTFFRLDKIN